MNTRTKFVRLTIILASLAVLPACWTYSLHSLSDKKHLVFDSALVGRWQFPGEEDFALVITADPSSQRYILEMVAAPEKSTNCDLPPEETGRHKYSGDLVQLGIYRFLDVVPVWDLKGEGYVVPHSILKVMVERDSLFLRAPNDEWLCGSKGQKLKIGECLDDSDPTFVLTASTEALQDFVRKHANDEQVFPNPNSAELWLHRKP